jgi:hypothetical protein
MARSFGTILAVLVAQDHGCWLGAMQWHLCWVQREDGGMEHYIFGNVADQERGIGNFGRNMAGLAAQRQKSLFFLERMAVQSLHSTSMYSNKLADLYPSISASISMFLVNCTPRMAHLPSFLSSSLPFIKTRRNLKSRISNMRFLVTTLTVFCGFSPSHLIRSSMEQFYIVNVLMSEN